MPFKDSVGQVVKLGLAGFTAIPLPMGLIVVKPTLDNMVEPQWEHFVPSGHIEQPKYILLGNAWWALW
jgi:hypothetical protein